MILHPLHMADLLESGLSESIIEEHRIESVRPGDINRLVGFNIPGLSSAYRIPFPPFQDGYERLKVFYAEGEDRFRDGKRKPKYIQRRGTPNRLYVPLPVFHVFQDWTEELYITEGEKKALAAAQAGIACIAITGLWNWKPPGTGLDRLIPDFDQIFWQGRKVRIVPDNDWLQPGSDGKPKNLKQAVFRLCRCLQLRGAHVEIILLPGGASHE